MSNIIWETKLDDQYACIVYRIDATRGQLMVKNLNTNAVVLDQRVDLTQGDAGVSTTDITAWYTLSKLAIENQ